MTFLLIPPYLIFAFFVMRNVLKKQPTRKRKWQIGLLTAFLLYLPLGWDVILGRAVFYGLCASQGGVHVYQTVELGPEYWNEDGSPRFVTKDGRFNSTVFNGKYKFEIIDKRYSENMMNTGQIIEKISDVSTGKPLGERVIIDYHGGWVAKYTGFFVRGSRCYGHEDNLGNSIYQDLLIYIFKKKINGKGERR